MSAIKYLHPVHWAKSYSGTACGSEKITDFQPYNEYCNSEHRNFAFAYNVVTCKICLQKFAEYKEKEIALIKRRLNETNQP